MIATKRVPLRLERPTMSRDYLSFSSISLFQSCPLRWNFRYMLGLPEERVAASLVFGSCLHRAVQHHFEQHLAGQSIPDLDTLLDVYQDHWESYDQQAIRFGKYDNRDTYGRLADRMLRAFLESQFANPYGVVIAVEEELRGPIVPGCPDLLGRLDLIVETSDALVVSDFKTSRNAWGYGKVEASAPQLLLYGELVKDLAGDKPVRLQFAVITKAKAPSLTLHAVAFNRHSVERTKRIIQRVWRAIESRHYYPNPSPMQCPTCPYRDPCRAWAA